MSKVRVPLKQIAGGPQCADPSSPPQSPMDEEEARLMEEVRTLETNRAGESSNMFTYVVIGSLLAFLLGSCIWIVVRN
jgi:hypothetical protein